ncbi:hypothetical protein ACPSXR_16830, partial [Escherichia coli]|uniref:hypothetical protein n=1 Tax=Escherichia coli TaxID=562 RepID=UPI003CE829C3
TQPATGETYPKSDLFNKALIALNIVRKEMNKYQKSLNMPVWVDICSAGCYNRASFTLFLIISRVKR